jgi:hypothetical protein
MIAVLSSWLGIWAVFRLLTAFSPFADLKGPGNIIPVLLIGWFAGAIASVVATMIVAGLISGLMQLCTGKSLYIGMWAPEGLKHLDSRADSFVALPVAAGFFAGFACWFFGFDPSLGLAGKIGIG